MDDKELIKNRIYEIKRDMGFRITGTSSRMLNDFIEEFFQKPIGTRIKIYDHYHSYDSYYDRKGSDNARRMMCMNIKRRLDTEYPNVEYELTRDYYLIRKSKTYKEQLMEELDMLQNKLRSYDESETI